ncbi:MAG TPA: class I SAM-dependent methyltransferase [Aggregatilineales bacterium]|nr:class I SAM-dependent methyltransferase [Aggregatilineales bacterium]
MVAKSAARGAKGEKGFISTGMMASWYAGITAKSMNEFVSDAKRMTKYLSAGDAVLEVAPGPGYLSVALAKLGNYRIVGMDISQAFVDIATQKAKEADVQVEFRQGDVSQMPFQADTFNLIVCRAAFKNFAAPVAALNEMYRVLKPGGKAVIIDLRHDATPAEVNKAVDAMGLGAVNRFMTKLTFKHMLLKRAYTVDSFKQLIAQSAFPKYDIQPDAIGMEIRLEK